MNLIPLITAAGLNAVINATNDGLQAKISTIALGDSAWSPDQTASALMNERARVPITGSTRVNPNQINVTAIEDGDVEYWVREIGFYLDDGTLLAIWSQPEIDRPLAYKAASIDLLLGFDLVLSALPVDSVVIEDAGGINLGPATVNVAGVVRFATEAEALAGNRNDIAISPELLKLVCEKKYKTQFATQDEALEMESNTLAMSPATTAAVVEESSVKFAVDNEVYDTKLSNVAMSPKTTAQLLDKKYIPRLDFGPVQTSGFLNNVNEFFDFIAPYGFFVVGLISVSNPLTQGRRWRVRYQQITVDTGPRIVR